MSEDPVIKNLKFFGGGVLPAVHIPVAYGRCAVHSLFRGGAFVHGPPYIYLWLMGDAQCIAYLGAVPLGIAPFFFFSRSVRRAEKERQPRLAAVSAPAPNATPAR